jgi:hypothetical protein
MHGSGEKIISDPTYAEKRRDTAISLGELLAWLEELRAIDNPIRREFHLFILLSESRPDAVKRATLGHINFLTRILHVPKPKGGEVKTLDIPLSRAMIQCLARVMRLGRALYPQTAEWVFPAYSERGHLVEHKENRAKLQSGVMISARRIARSRKRLASRRGSETGERQMENFNGLAFPAGPERFESDAAVNKETEDKKAAYVDTAS